jgi:predicted nucleic-acid-binding protein
MIIEQEKINRAVEFYKKIVKGHDELIREAIEERRKGKSKQADELIKQAKGYNERYVTIETIFVTLGICWYSKDFKSLEGLGESIPIGNEELYLEDFYSEVTK